MIHATGYAALSSLLVRQDLVPMVVGYVLIMGTLAAGLLMLRRSGRTASAGGAGQGPGTNASPAGSSAVAPSRQGWLRLIRHVINSEVGGYLVLMVAVIAYYYGIARVSGNFIESAFTGCALLLGLCTPVFLAASWLDVRWQRHKATRGPRARRIPRVRIGRRQA
jgi:hypothetical protein